jgi:hypothetical protein
VIGVPPTWHGGLREAAFKNGASALVANTNCRRTGFIIAFLLFSRSPRPEDNQTAALKAQLPATYLFGASAYGHSFDDFRTKVSSLRTIKAHMLRPSARPSNWPRHSIGRTIGRRASPIKATLFVAQNTNNHFLVRPGCLNCKKEPASERDSDGPVDQRKNDGVDHASLFCYLAHARNHIACPSFLVSPRPT